MTLNATLLFIPLPLSNIVPALVIALISLAYLEEDGLLALRRFAGRRHCTGGRVGGGLAGCPRREMDYWLLVSEN